MTVLDNHRIHTGAPASRSHVLVIAELVSEAIRGFGGSFKSLLNKSAEVRRNRMNRAAVENLRGLDPVILRDIGLTPGDVSYALSLPVEIDAAEVLNEIRLKHKKQRNV